MTSTRRHPLRSAHVATVITTPHFSTRSAQVAIRGVLDDAAALLLAGVLKGHDAANRSTADVDVTRVTSVDLSALDILAWVVCSMSCAVSISPFPPAVLDALIGDTPAEFRGL